jgi:D-serine dehydratase
MRCFRARLKEFLERPAMIEKGRPNIEADPVSFYLDHERARATVSAQAVNKMRSKIVEIAAIVAKDC